MIPLFTSPIFYIFLLGVLESLRDSLRLSETLTCESLSDFLRLLESLRDSRRERKWEEPE